ncbi:8-oxo-dGTP diphosphatase MutT [Jeotgalibacillus soli]|uniref:8-oxo-dGTP diphosphatase n=1 Tax=Jeotgalibacillus soli TaxID=889306 RepID=A0A0C2W703_9BACL|nr:8-oxo-dGTP diphosphatase MutT [Jeotgalibacillus soli]KIL51813.1 DNA mismatch repair protein MutT [Jeotgalibacillus soli]
MKKTINVAGAIITNDQDEVLCALRSPEMSLPNVWEFPGGKIEQGEQPEQALYREIQEELGCTLNIFELVEDTTHEYENMIVRLMTYKASILKGEPTAREHAEIKWVSLDHLRSLEWAPADLPAVNKLLAADQTAV